LKIKEIWEEHEIDITFGIGFVLFFTIMIAALFFSKKYPTINKSTSEQLTCKCVIG